MTVCTGQAVASIAIMLTLDLQCVCAVSCLVHTMCAHVCAFVFMCVQGILVGEWWQDRLDCRQWGAHRPHVAGIAGQSGVGAQVCVLCAIVCAQLYCCSVWHAHMFVTPP